jgi:hypothetical protein
MQIDKHENQEPASSNNESDHIQMDSISPAFVEKGNDDSPDNCPEINISNLQDGPTQGMLAIYIW